MVEVSKGTIRKKKKVPGKTFTNSENFVNKPNAPLNESIFTK